MSIWGKMLWSGCIAWFLNLEVLLLLFFMINCLEYNNKKLETIYNSLTSWKNEGLEDLRLWQWCKSSWPVVICRLNSLLILLEYFQKYLYLSTFKMTTFLLLVKYILISTSYFILSSFFVRNETFTWLQFSSTFYTTEKEDEWFLSFLS